MKFVMLMITFLFVFSLVVYAQEPVTQVPVTTDSSRQAANAPPDVTKTHEAGTQAALTIGKMIFCTGVENREPQGEAAEFASSVGKLYFWTEIKNAGDPSTVTHVWYHDDNQIAKVELPVKFARNRVWSVKSIPEASSGTWKVVVLSPAGDKLGELSCSIK